jgi:hypothetical protein
MGTRKRLGQDAALECRCGRDDDVLGRVDPNLRGRRSDRGCAAWEALGVRLLGACEHGLALQQGVACEPVVHLGGRQ